MSEENVERIRRAFDAFNRRDLDVFLALIDPEVEFTTRYMEMEGDPYYRGRDLQEVCMPCASLCASSG